jgi:two-component system OmpR family sensor kinase
MKVRLLLILIPVILGLIAGLILNLSGASNPILYLRADLGTFLFILGLGISVILALVQLVRYQMEVLEKEVIEESNRERRRFISLLDHELKNPLTAIMAGLANLDLPPKSPTLESISAQVQQINRLVTDLRKLSNLETRQFELSKVDLPELLEDVYELSKSRIGDSRIITLSMPQAPWPLPALPADRDLLFLAIHNVLDNAIKFTEPGDRIEIRASENGSEVQIEIADTGPGIPAEEIDQVWAELFRGKNARGIPGSGLGLSLVQAIIRRHGGTISIRSQVEVGTEILMKLPFSGVTDL